MRTDVRTHVRTHGVHIDTNGVRINMHSVRTVHTHGVRIVRTHAYAQRARICTCRRIRTHVHTVNFILSSPPPMSPSLFKSLPHPLFSKKKNEA